MHVKRVGVALIVLIMSLSVTGIALGADLYKLDKSHTKVGFMVRHLVISKVRGQFMDYDATLQLDLSDMTKSSMQGSVKTASINTDNAKRDKHLRNPDFFEVEKYPEITFVSKAVQKAGNGYVMVGDFTMHGVTKEIAMPFTITEPIVHRGKTRVGFEAQMQVNRQDYGIAYNKLADTGGLAVGNKVLIEINGEAIKQ